MDPDENLKQQRALIHQINEGRANGTMAEDLAELVEALDRWLSQAGFPPEDWKRL